MLYELRMKICTEKQFRAILHQLQNLVVLIVSEYRVQFNDQFVRIISHNQLALLILDNR